MHATPSRQRYRIEQTHVGVGALPAYARRSVCRNEQYARRFGYTHTLTRNSLLKPNEYAASWNKVARLLQLRDAGVTDTLVSFDIDVQVLDHTRSLAELLAPCGDAGSADHRRQPRIAPPPARVLSLLVQVHDQRGLRCFEAAPPG